MVICCGVMLPESGRYGKLLVQESAKAGLQKVYLLVVEPLVSRVRVMWLRPVWAYQRGG